MRIVNCEHPKFIYNRYTNSHVRVACGKCATCCNTRAKRWINRIDAETRLHKFTYMVTLTYDNDHLPAYFLSDDLSELVSNRDELSRIPLSELIDLCHDEYGEYLEDCLSYLRDRLVHPLGLPVVCTSDLSKFFKRFNKYCFKHVTHHYENIRYFACWEYGPTTYRPHVHMVLWFDEDSIANRFDEILSSCWTLGRSDGDAAYSRGAGSYVAQYVNRPTHLPAFYAHPKICQRHQFSHSPSIGLNTALDERISEIYSQLPVQRTVWNSQSAKYVTVPIDVVVKNRFFPKCPEYSQRSHHDRVTLYGATEIIYSDTFQDFRYSVDLCRWLTYRNIATDDERDIAYYFQRVKRDAKDEKSYVATQYRLYSMSKRICYFARILGTTLDALVSKIEEFWTKVDYLNLKTQLQFQCDYVQNSHQITDLIHLYPEFSLFSQSMLAEPTILPKVFRYYFDDVGIDDPADIPKLEDTHDYRSMSQLHNKIYKDSHKRMHCNAYRDSKLQIDDPQLAGIVRKYQKYHSIYGL